MIRIDFRERLTALEIRDPAIEVFEEVASVHGLFTLFRSPQQAALSGNSRMPRATRTRIGNGKHQSWYVDYMVGRPSRSEITTSADRDKTVGTLGLRAPVDKEHMEYGGFDYGEFGEPNPTYSYITVHTISELEFREGVDPSKLLLEATYNGLIKVFEAGYPRLFEVEEFSTQDDVISR